MTELLRIGEEPELAPGVKGYTIDNDDGLWIPVIYAENQGSGQVAAYLDSLPTDRQVTFPNVMNPKLAEMLARRNFHLVQLHHPDVGRYDAWRRKPCPTT